MWEQLPWFYQANAWLPRNVVLANAKKLEALPAAQRDALLRAAAAAEERGWQLSRDNAAQSLAALRSAGMKIGLLDNGTRSRLDRAGGDLTADAMRRADPELLGVLSAYLASSR
jgi:TRAP-type C4-dicarboxylate transport system substrate-binding protein